MSDLTAGSDRQPGQPPIGPRPPALVELPLLPQHERWLTIESTYPDATTPLVHLAHRIRGPLVVDAWLGAVDALVARHEILRARFPIGMAGRVMVIEPPSGVRVDQIDLTDLPEPQRAGRAGDLLADRQKVRFDLDRGPLIDACLVRLADGDHVWTMTIHHSLADGASAVVLDQDLGALYRALVTRAEPDLPELPVQTGDYAVWRAATHRPADAEEDRRYWVEQLTGVPPLELRTDLPRPPAKGAPAALVRHLIGTEVARQVDELARTARCTRFIVVLTALQVLLSRWSGQRRFCIGFPVAGSERNVPELAGLVGPFNNVVALRCDLSGDPTFLRRLEGTRATVLEALIHQDLPFLDVVRALGLPHDPSRTVPYQVLFLFDEFDETGVASLPGLAVEEFPLPFPKIPYDLMIYAKPRPEGLWMNFFYDTALFTGSTVTAMVRDYELILQGAVDRPNARLSQPPLA